jgi:hypothetical protein
MLRYLLCALALFASGGAIAHDDMDMSHMEMAHGVPLGASAAFDAKGRLWVVDAVDKHIRVRHSDDMGRSLVEPTIVNPVAEPIYAEGENRPKLVFGTKGEIYVSWSQPRKAPYTGFVRFSRSLDGGKHFDAPLTVHADRAEITHRFDSLIVDGEGRVVVAWIDKRDVELAKAAGKPYLGAATYYAWSDDRGASFKPERKIVDNSCECCRIALARAPDGKVDAFFRAIYGDNIRDHAYATLPTDGSAPDVKRATLTQWHIEGCPHHGPSLSIAADGSRHAVWFSAADGKATIWYGQLDPGKAPKHLLTVAGAGGAHADVVANGNQVWIAWNQMTPAGLELMLRESTDGGIGFGEARQIAQTKDAAGGPQLLLWQGRAFVAWNTAGGFRLVPTELMQ